MCRIDGVALRNALFVFSIVQITCRYLRAYLLDIFTVHLLVVPVHRPVAPVRRSVEFIIGVPIFAEVCP